eukprot:3584545-Prymnesium_polylepis.1
MAVNGTKVNDHVDCIREVDAEPVLQLKVWGLTSSRSLRLFRQPGLRFGVSVADNEIGPGVLISELTKDGLCFRQVNRARAPPRRPSCRRGGDVVGPPLSSAAGGETPSPLRPLVRAA